MIALLGQTTRDEIIHVDGRQEERCGGAPIFAARALACADVKGVVITRGGGDLAITALPATGLPVVIGPAVDTFISRLTLRSGGHREHTIAALGTPFSRQDLVGWAATALAEATTVAVGTQWRGDVPPDVLHALVETGKRVVYDAQGLARPGLGPVQPSGPLDATWLDGVAAVKFSDDEARALLGGTDVAALKRAGVPIVTVTYGEGGCDVWTTGDRVACHIPADRIPLLADTVGAGDMFTALLAAALANGDDPITATEYATFGVARVLRLRC